MGKKLLKLSHSGTQEYHTSEIDDKTIIEGILNNSNETFKYLYKHYQPKIKRMVWTFKNVTLDPDEIFQEGLIRLIHNIRFGKFKEDSSVYTYLNSICRNICLKQLTGNNYMELNKDVNPETEDDNKFDLLEDLISVKSNLDYKCQTIIDLRFGIIKQSAAPQKNTSFDEIGTLLNITAANARQRFKRCLEKLRELVKANPSFND